MWLERQSLRRDYGCYARPAPCVEDLARIIDAEKSDLFDVLGYIAFTVPPVSREERTESHRDQIMASYQEKQQEFLDFVLGQYEPNSA